MGQENSGGRKGTCGSMLGVSKESQGGQCGWSREHRGSLMPDETEGNLVSHVILLPHKQ